jgi:hypothetical protein
MSDIRPSDTHLCRCGCGREVPRKLAEPRWRWLQRMYATRECRRIGEAETKRQKQRAMRGRYDGGAQSAREVMAARPNVDAFAPPDSGEYWR